MYSCVLGPTDVAIFSSWDPNFENIHHIVQVQVEFLDTNGVIVSSPKLIDLDRHRDGILGFKGIVSYILKM